MTEIVACRQTDVRIRIVIARVIANFFLTKGKQPIQNCNEDDEHRKNQADGASWENNGFEHGAGVMQNETTTKEQLVWV